MSRVLRNRLKLLREMGDFMPICSVKDGKLTSMYTYQLMGGDFFDGRRLGVSLSIIRNEMIRR